jgi:hypothetical protein
MSLHSRNAAAGLSSQRCPVTAELAPNRVRTFDGFHVSYNAHTFFYDSDTTALVLRDRLFLVLNGDHSSEMLDAASRDGLPYALRVFMDRLDVANQLSEHRMALGFCDDPFELQPTMLEAIGRDAFDRFVAAVTASYPDPRLVG